MGKGKNIIYDEKGVPHWKTKEYDSRIGKLDGNYNRGNRCCLA